MITMWPVTNKINIVNDINPPVHAGGFLLADISYWWLRR